MARADRRGLPCDDIPVPFGIEAGAFRKRVAALLRGVRVSPKAEHGREGRLHEDIRCHVLAPVPRSEGLYTVSYRRPLSALESRKDVAGLEIAESAFSGIAGIEALARHNRALREAIEAEYEGATRALEQRREEARRFSKHKEEFGKGTIEGVAGSEAANNAVTGGSLIPTLTLGIPGESVTAVLMGGLIIHGLQPGPELFTTYAGMTYTFFAGFVLVQFFMLGVGALGCRGFAHIARLSDAILIPSIFLLCVVGSYAIHNNVVEVVIMLIFGVIGYLARKFDLNAAAIVLGLILGPIGERGLRRSLLISDGDPSILFSTPLCWVLIALCVVGVLSPLLMERMERRMREDLEC